ncbi:MAG: hypothetical protein ABJA82_09755 [Myxococcales bacterium]
MSDTAAIAGRRTIADAMDALIEAAVSMGLDDQSAARAATRRLEILHRAPRELVFGEVRS